MRDNNCIRAPLALVDEGATLAAPTLATDGREVPTTTGGYRPRRLVLAFESEDPGCTITAPVLVHGYSEERWRSLGVLNDGAAINATEGLEIEIVWNGCDRISVSSAGVAGGTATVKVAAVEVL
jgi:hypothetical protein